ncbi:MAG: type II toxin-antitoxin system RelE/ParE family toxin [Chloroflexota bacterium]
MTRFTVYVQPSALEEVKDLPGNFRQRVKRAISDLEQNATPPTSKKLDLSKVSEQIDVGKTVYRIQIDRWRIIYSVSDSEEAIDVLAVRKRPPYDYGDLGKLLEEIE